jgi:predicted permease
MAKVHMMFWSDALMQDLRYGVRALYRNVSFTAVAVLALALGIGVNTAVFTAYRAMVARPLDARDSGELVNLALRRDSGGGDFSFSYPDYEAYRDSIRSFSGLIAFNPERLTLSNVGGSVSQRTANAGTLAGRLGLLSAGAINAEFASVFAVSENYFEVLGVRPQRGRSFESIGIPELLTSPSVLISENYWQRRFSGDSAILGKIVHLNGVAMTIVGITPHDFVGTGVAVPDFWLPLSLEPLVHGKENWLRDRENKCCRLFARLASHLSISLAQSEMAPLVDHLRGLHDSRSDSARPASVLMWPGSPFPLPLNMYPGLGLTILLIMTAAGMVLVVACANVASLQLARGRSRENELRTRLSLGAGRRRLIRQLLTESALLGVLSGVVALFFTWVLLDVSVALIGNAFPAEAGTLIFHVAPDTRIFGFVLAVSLFAGMLFGLVPALEGSGSALSSAVRSSTSPIHTRRLQDFLLAAQVALSLVLMIAGTMFIRSSFHALKTDAGYEAKRVVELNLQFPEASRYTADRKLALIRELRSRLGVLAGVTAITSARPPASSALRTGALVARDSFSPNVLSILYYSRVQPNYFQTLGIPLLLGRSFQPQATEAEDSVIVSESTAKELWPGLNPIGRSLRLGATDERVRSQSELSADGPSYEVIGVARDTRGIEFDGSGSRQVYLPLSDDKLDGRPILIRTESDPVKLMRDVDLVTSSLDPDLVNSSDTLEEQLRQSPPFIVSSLAAAVATTVGLLGLLLAIMGIYGTVSYIVVMRTREVGIRMAVGAQKTDILGMIMRESTRPVVCGLLAGILISIAVSYSLRRFWYGLSTVDTVSFVAVSALFLTVSILAALPPCRRAMLVDPMVALRYE